jgi:hypothetical protein
MRGKRTATPATEANTEGLPDVTPEASPEVPPEVATDEAPSQPEPTEAQIREAFTGPPGLYGYPDPRRSTLLNDAIARIEADEAARKIIDLRKRTLATK